MTMTLHKLTAGDGYEYLTRQVAAADATDLGRSSLADYYSAKGESPGHWVGTGLASLSETGPREVSPHTLEKVYAVPAGSVVSAEQMRALFGEGRHPNKKAITDYVTARGVHPAAAAQATKLGHEFYLRDGETGFTRALAVAYREHNEALGQEWNAPISASLRATIRTTLARETFARRYGRAPADERELTGFIARETRARTTAVAGYDLTFSPVKSVSALWAIAPREVSGVIEKAHDAAVADALAWLQEHAAFSRSGTNGIAQVDTTGLIGAAFTHRDSRAGDPDLHTHVAISNKVAVRDAHGITRWLALDGQPLHRVAVAASEVYNTRLEAHLGDRLNLRFAAVKPSRAAKRPIREVVGVSTELMQLWSSRRAAIETRTAELSKAFQHTHGREPTLVEMIALAQQATLESREAKHEPRSLAEQRHTWRTQAIDLLGGARELTAMLSACLSQPARHREPVTEAWITERAAEVIATVSTARATWQAHHVFAEAQRIVRGFGRTADDTLAQRITDAALDDAYSIPIARVADEDLAEPQALRRRDGVSVYTRHGAALFTSADIVAAERRILHAAYLRNGRTASEDDVALALADAAARGKDLNPGQAALVADMATNGRRLALALAPAGSGKTTAMAALAHAWRTSGGTVIGLAPSASAAITLGADLDAVSDTVDKYTYSIDNPSGSQLPQWFRDINEHSLLIVDEAGKAGTGQLDTLIAHALAKGASVRLIGDDHQIASISAGGVLRDIAIETGALTLSQIVRFTSPAEAAATLALHRGDPAGIGFYIDHQRVHVGSEATAADMAFEAWRTDITAGRDSILLAPTNAIVDDLNARARTARLAAASAADSHFRVGRQALLSDGLHASVGDVVRTRKNARWLRLSTTDYVRNGYAYEVVKVGKNGSLRVRHTASGRETTFPARYVAEHVTLGYAWTIDSAQGLTARHRCHTVGADHLSRQLLYVAMTRGRNENHIYLSTAEADPHRVLAPKATHPDTAVDVLTKILARDEAQVSATTASRNAEDPFTRLGPAADMYYDALGTLAEIHAGKAAMARIDTHADTVYGGLTDMPAWPTLRKHLAILAVDGDDPITRLAAAANARELGTAADVAAVLDWRLDHSGNHNTGTGPLAWLPAIPEPLHTSAQVGPYLASRAQLSTDLAEQIRTTVHTWSARSAPAWARTLLTTDPELTADIAIFRAAHHVAAEDTRLLGAEQYAIRSRTVQRRLEQRATAAILTQRPDTARWRQLIDGIDPRITTDTYWPQLAEHLADAARSRSDLAALVTTSANERPLPDELPAAALWWRICAELSPTATLETTHSGIRPPWIRDLHALFGSTIAETIVADPAWPGLVSAIAAADPTRWTPPDLLHVAAEQLSDADPDRHIPITDYARLITYTIDLLCTPHRYQHDDEQLPDHPPHSPDDEEQLPPDLQAHDTGAPTGHAPPHLDEPNPFHTEPPPDHHDIPDRFAGTAHAPLEFAQLAAQRPAAPHLAPALADVYALRDRFTLSRTELDALEREVRANNGPAMRAAAPRIPHMRHRADADRPYLIAIEEVIAAWAEADHSYENALHQLNAAQTHLDELRLTPQADPLDIESASRYVDLLVATLPADSPAHQFQPQLAQAHQDRAAAAGGAAHIISGAQVDAFIAATTDQDLATLNRARREHADLRVQLDRAEAAAAAAFAAATTRTAQHIADQQQHLATEMRVLEVAGTNRPDRGVTIGPTALTGLDPNHAASLSALAQLPFTVTALHAPPGKDRTQALHTLRAAYTAAGRKVLWCSPTEEQAQQAAGEQLADSATSVTAAHTKLSQRTWQLPPNSLVIIDNATGADPHQLADIAELVDQSNARLILINPSHHQQWPPPPAERLLRLLDSELPWSMTLGSELTPARNPLRQSPPDQQPILHQSRQLAPDVVDEPISKILHRADQLHTANTSAYQRHLTITWTRRQDRAISTLDLARDDGIEPG
ncbi:MobF family relaxase [Mycobacterium simiae]|uniref:MobF family relaxase n=1 Tax=Mycobacterium simiae TaxID=1784 RepID=UPI003F4CB6D3